MNIFSKLSIFTMLSLPLAAEAQFQGEVYKPDTSFKVFANGSELSMAFGGGFNNPQISMADLNHDGKQDLVVYERMNEEVKTYINKGTASNPDYRYAAEYEKNFPLVNQYLRLLDYNCDGIPDLFHRGTMYGFEVYKGYYNANNQLSFTFYQALFHPSSSGWVNAYCDPGDIPGIVDIDEDGDVDFLAFSILGARLQWYQNMRVEEGLPCDSIKIVLKDKCWGKIYQSYERTHVLASSCAQNKPAAGGGSDEDESDPNPTSGNKTTLHTGNTLCFYDHDGDGDMDYLNGNILFSDIQFLKNGRVETGYPKDTITAQDTTWQAGGHIYNTNLWPSAYYEDIDQDGDKDIIITPHGENISENVKCIAWYKNTGTATSPVFTYAGDSLITNENIDMGTGAYPMLYDYDKDGKIDLFVGGDGAYQSTGNPRAKIAYYRNTSTPGNPSFTLENANFLNIFALNVRGAYPAVGDLNNDGKDDLLVGQANGNISFYTNNAASGSVAPNWQLNTAILQDVAGVNIDSTQFPAPFIYDVDKDGKKDLVLGGVTGWLYYYKNIGNANELKLQHQTSKLGLAKADPQSLYNGYSAPFIGKIDNTNQDYLLMGSNSGILYRYTGFQNGNTTTPYQRLDSGYSYINNRMTVYSGSRSVPAVADLDGDGKYEMIMGNILGGLKIFKQSFLLGTGPDQHLAENKVTIYPNPAKDNLYINWEKNFADGSPVIIELYSMTGQKVVSTTVQAGVSAAVSTRHLGAGVYQCVISSSGARAVQKVVIMN